MKVFISCSGERSRAVAGILYAWLPHVIQALEPWISEDIDKGKNWPSVITAQLQETNFGMGSVLVDRIRIDAKFTQQLLS